MSRNRIYSHKELALFYFPELSPASASKRLSSWIDRDEDLLLELKTAGYQKGQRLFTPRQTDVLFDHLGEPRT